MSKPYINFNPLNKQRGVVLIMALVILMVLSLLGVSSMRNSSLQERMSGNARDYQVAFEAAEIALRAGEDYLGLIATTSDFNSSGNNGKFTPRTLSDPDAWKVETNWSSGKTTTVDVTSLPNDPEYMIELLDSNYGVIDPLTPGGGESGTISLFRITARGYGKNPNTRVMLQTDYGKIM